MFSSVGLANVWFSEEYVGYFAGQAKLDPLLHTWSLAVEEQFYVVLALGVFLLQRSARVSRTRFVRYLLVIVAIGAVSSLMLAVVGWTNLRSFLPAGQGFLGYYSPVPRVWEFAAGILLAGIFETKGQKIGLPARNFVGIVGLFLVLLSFFLPSASDTGMRLFATLGAVTGASMLILAGEGKSSQETAIVSRLLGSIHLVWIGNRSYSLYLWHWPAIIISSSLIDSAIRVELGFLFGVILGVTSHSLVGTPWRTISDSHLPQLASIAVFGLLPVLILGGAVGAGPGSRLTEGVVVLPGQYTETLGRSFDCLLERDFNEADLSRCRFGPRSPWVALVGDSHADALSDGVVGASLALGHGTLALTGAGCDFTRSPNTSPEADLSNCPELADSVIQEILKEPIASAVFISETSVGDHILPAVWEFKEAGVPVIFVRDVPWIQPNRDFGSGDFSIGPCSGQSGRPVCQVSRASIVALGYRESEQSLIDAIGFSHVVDPWDSFCDSRFCYGIIGSEILYWDGNHLNANGSAFLEPKLRAALLDVLER